MEKYEKIKNNRLLLILFFVFGMLPCLLILGTSCSMGEGSSSTSNGDIYTVVFYTNTDKKFNIPKQEIEDGSTVRRPTDFPNRYQADDGSIYQFVGWYTDPTCKQEFLWKFETDEVHSNMTLYAKWDNVSL